jgi:hypothetical protein
MAEISWYIARDEKQFGPITQAEFDLFVNGGHLQPTDLLWREGFPDWRPAMVVFPPRGPAPAPSLDAPFPTRTQPAPRPPSRAERAHPDDGEDYDAPRRGRGKRIAVVLLLVAALAAAGSAAYVYRTQVTQAVASLVAFAPSDAMAIADRKSLETPPLAGFRGGPPESIDATLQDTALWRVIKREFPDWYTQRLDEAMALARENKDDAAIGQHMARKLVELRRQQAASALSATLPRLKTVASAFFDNLVKLRRHSVEACYGYISQGQASPVIVSLLQGTEHTAHLHAQLTSVFEAIAEGRKQPRVYPRPQQADYQMLAADLIKLGWTQQDMQLFSNERALAQAPPEKVCQLVHDWFAAQLAVRDPDAQMRLLVDSLRPIFAG